MKNMKVSKYVKIMPNNDAEIVDFLYHTDFKMEANMGQISKVLFKYGNLKEYLLARKGDVIVKFSDNTYNVMDGDEFNEKFNNGKI